MKLIFFQDWMIKRKFFIDCLEAYDGTQEKEEILLKAKEEYFRLFDTVCLYVLNGSITLENFTNIYKERVEFIVQQFDGDFGKDSVYKNTIKANKTIKELK